jgi:glycosyltransferase involved in cell wall biosynthesis
MISVVMPVTNRLDLFKKTLPSLIRQRITAAEDWELVIVDWNSTDGIEDFLKTQINVLRIHYVRVDVRKGFVPVYMNGETMVNPALSWNIGIRKSKGEILVITSPEVIQLTDAVFQFRAAHKHCVGVPVILAFVADALRPETDTTHVADNPGMGVLVSSTFREKDAGLYFLGSVPKKLLEAINGIDEEYMRGLSYEDTDTGRRMMAAGARLVHDDEIIGIHQWHPRVQPYGDGWMINEKRFQVGYRIVANVDHQWGDFGCILHEWEGYSGSIQ